MYSFGNSFVFPCYVCCDYSYSNVVLCLLNLRVKKFGVVFFMSLFFICLVILFLTVVKNIQNIKFTILLFLSVQLSGIKSIQIIIQPPDHPSPIFLASQTETPHPFNNLHSPPPPSPWQPLFYFCSCGIDKSRYLISGIIQYFTFCVTRFT